MNRGLNYPTSRYLTTDIRAGGTIITNVEPGYENFHHIIPLFSFGKLHRLDLSLIYSHSGRDTNIGFGRGNRLSITYDLFGSEDGEYLTLKYPDGFIERFNKRVREITTEGNVELKTEYVGVSSYNIIEKHDDNYELSFANGYKYVLTTNNNIPLEIYYKGVLSYRIQTNNYQIIIDETWAPTARLVIDKSRNEPKNYTDFKASYPNEGVLSNPPLIRCNLTYNQDNYLTDILLYRPINLSNSRQLNSISITNASTLYSVSSIADEFSANAVLSEDKVIEINTKFIHTEDDVNSGYQADKINLTYTRNGTLLGNEVLVASSSGEELTFYFYVNNRKQYTIDSKGNYAQFTYNSGHQLEKTVTGLSSYFNKVNNNYIKNGSFLDGVNNWITFGTVDVVSNETIPTLPGVSRICELKGNSEITQSFQFNGVINSTISLAFFGKTINKYTSLIYKLRLLKDGLLVEETSEVTKNILNYYDLYVIEISAKKLFDEVQVVIASGNDEAAKVSIADIIVISHPVTTHYVYDHETGQLLNEIYGSITTTREYDSYRNLVKTNRLGTMGGSYTYTPSGMLIGSSSFAQGVKNDFEFSTSGQLLGKTIGNHNQLLSETYKYENYGINQPKSFTNSLGIMTSYEYYQDTLQVSKVTIANQIATHYKYDDFFRLTSQSLTMYSNEIPIYEYKYDYFSSNNYGDLISKISSKDMNYYFDYTKRLDISKVSFKHGENSQTFPITSYTYRNQNDPDSYDNLELIEKEYPIGKYIFSYNDDKFINKVSYEDATFGTKDLFLYRYNALNQLIEIENLTNPDLNENFSYNNDKAIDKISKNGHELKFGYDNLGNLNSYDINYGQSKKNVEINQNYRLYAFDPDAIYGLYQKSNNRYSNFTNLFVQKIDNASNKVETVINPNLIRYEVNDDKLLTKEINAVKKDYQVAYYGQFNAFKFTASKHTYLEYRHNFVTNPIFTRDGFTLSFWFKVNDIYGDKTLALMVDGPNKNTIVQINASEQQDIYVDIKFIGQAIQRGFVLSRSRYRKGWNFLTFSWRRSESRQMSEYLLGLNGEFTYKEETNSTSLYFPNDASLIIGAGYDFNMTSIIESDTEFTGIMIKSDDFIDYQEISDYYKITRKLYIYSSQIDDELLTIANNGVNDYSRLDEVPQTYNIFPLHQTVYGINGNKELSYKPNLLLDSELDHGFAFNNRLNRYLYVADGDHLVYNTKLSHSGYIGVFFIRQEDVQNQCLFEATSSNGMSFSVERRYYGRYPQFLLIVNGTAYTINGFDNMDKINHVGVTWTKTVGSDSLNPSVYRFRVIFNNKESIHDISVPQTFNNIALSLGRRSNETYVFNLIGRTSYPLYGQIEFLTYNDIFMSKKNIEELVNKLRGVTTSIQSDGLGLVRKQVVSRGDTSISKKNYSYYLPGETKKISTLLTQETETTITGTKTKQYVYNSFGNLNLIKENNIEIKAYEYDLRGFLTRERDLLAQTQNTYSYDNAGNILSIAGQRNIDFTYESPSTSKLQRLIKAGDKYIDYLDNSLLPSSIYLKGSNGLRLNVAILTWQGRQLIKYTKNKCWTYQYDYDDQGLRVSKNVNGVVTNFTYFNGLLMLEKRDNVMIRYRYNGNTLYGFTYEDGVIFQEYFYDRDAFANINGIFDEQGNKVVSYAYDAYGNLLNISDDTTIGIGTINKIRYKGYYYDEETNFFYCNSRYYSPEFCRFISADSVEYLDPEHTSGLNLYCYCYNNPISYADPSGCLPQWAMWLIGGVVIAGLAIATIATGGAAGGVAGFILAGALKGAVVGTVSGALVNGTISGISSAIDGEGFWSGFAEGAAHGFMSGAVIGGITGAISSGLQVAKAASYWDKGTFSSGYKSMKYHYTQEVVNKGLTKGNSIVKYTSDAVKFSNNNGMNFTLNLSRNGLQNSWSLSRYFGSGANGLYTSSGNIITFHYFYMW